VSHLILIRHSNSFVEADLPANQWRLSGFGEERARGLAPILDPYKPTTLISSSEPKAIETAAIAAAMLGLDPKIAEGLHEHERTTVGWTTRDEFEERVSDFFIRQDQLVFGEETANEAYLRFDQVIQRILEEHTNETAAVVSHGTVISLFVCSRNDVDPHQFWQSLEMPSVVVMTLETFELETVLYLDNSQTKD
jgi:broad specificity phosphatase PhoE